MNFEEFSRGVKYLATLNPGFKSTYELTNEALLTTWFNTLKPFSAKQFKEGIDSMTANCSDYPKFATLLDFVKRQREYETDRQNAEIHRAKMLEIFPGARLPPAQPDPIPKALENPKDALDHTMLKIFELHRRNQEKEREALDSRLHVV